MKRKAFKAAFPYTLPILAGFKASASIVDLKKTVVNIFTTNSIVVKSSLKMITLKRRGS